MRYQKTDDVPHYLLVIVSIVYFYINYKRGFHLLNKLNLREIVMTTSLEYSNLIRTEYCPQLIIPELAKSVGLEEAIVIQQLHYWLHNSGKLFEDTLWIYNSFNEWSKQFAYWSISKIKRVFYSLEAKGLIISKKLNASKHDHTKWYTIEYNKVLSLLPKSSIVRKKKASVSPKEKMNNRLYQLDTNINSNSYTNSTYINNLSNEKNHNKTTIKKVNTDQIKTKTEISNFGKEICEQMIKTWDEVFIYQNDRLVLTKNRTVKLLNLWDKYFHKNIEEWKVYCVAINSSKFLMGEKKSGFKARFDWLISEDVANRIFLKEFDIGDRVPDIQAQDLKLKVEERKKLIEQQKTELEVQKTLEEEKRRVELLAERLASEELQKQEGCWSEKDREDVRKAFENYMNQEAIEDHFLASFKSIFTSDKWASNFIDYYYEYYKIKFCLKQKFDDFVSEAQKQLGFIN